MGILASTNCHGPVAFDCHGGIRHHCANLRVFAADLSCCGEIGDQYMLDVQSDGLKNHRTRRTIIRSPGTAKVPLQWPILRTREGNGASARLSKGDWVRCVVE